jgi:hypothetical protein
LSAIIPDSLLRVPPRVSSHILTSRDLISVFQIAGLNGNTNSISSDVYYIHFNIFTAVVLFFVDKAHR